MRIDVLTSLYPSPKAPFEGIFAARKWEGMAARGHEVRLVVPLPWAPKIFAPLMSPERARIAASPAQETRSGIEIIRPRYLHIPKGGAKNADRFAAAGIREVLTKRKEGSGRVADVCVLDYAWPAAAAAPRLEAARVPCVINGRGSDVLQVQDVAKLRSSLVRGLGSASALTAVSQDLLDAMVELRADGHSAPAVLTPNGVDSTHFCLGDRASARAALGEESSGEVVLVVGHLIERKDPLLALGAFLSMDRPGARLLFVGRGPLEGALTFAIQRAGAGDRVRLLGERPPEELVHWYRAADVTLLTSSREGRPNVVLEALSSGCPVLATHAGGTSEVIPDHGRMLAKTREPAEIGAMLMSLLEQPPKADTLRASVEPLSWAKSLDALESLLTDLVAGTRTGTAP